MVLGGIYVIENTVNGNRYIGSACNLTKRKNLHLFRFRHKCHDNTYLQYAYEKYGEESFKFRPILYCERFELLRYEQALLDKLNPEYNIARTAGNTLGCKRTEDAKRKISEKNTGRKDSEETRKRKSAASTGRRWSEENKQKLSQKKKGIPRPKDVVNRYTETRKKNGNHKGHPMTEEERQRISINCKKYWEDRRKSKE